VVTFTVGDGARDEYRAFTRHAYDVPIGSNQPEVMLSLLITVNIICLPFWIIYCYIIYTTFMGKM